MEKGEVQWIARFLSDVYEGICEGHEASTTQQQLTQLYRAIKLQMDETFKPEDEGLKGLPASLG